MRKIILALAAFVSLSASAQVTGQFVEEKAINISDRTAVNDTLYNAVKNYKAIMIGGPHGIKETPELVVGLVRSLQKGGKKVVCAFEIASDGLKGFKKDPTLDALKRSTFFTTKSPDGKQCMAWAQMLVDLRALDAEIVYMGLDLAQKGDEKLSRDSLMYEKLNAAFKTDTARVLVTLTNNLSNKLTPIKGLKNNLAYYMQKDERSCFKNQKILSLNHYYGNGTTMNWANDGYKLREVKGNAAFYEYATSYENYLLIYGAQEGYNGIFFSKTITASPPLVEKL